MHDDTIQQVIDWINDPSRDGDVFYRMLTPTVARGKAWPRAPSAEHEVYGYEFFFIFIDVECVGAVLDMGEANLHGYVASRWRHQTVMSRALVDMVFPMLAVDGRKRQSVTFQDPAIQHFLERVGFTITKAPTHGEEGHACRDLVVPDTWQDCAFTLHALSPRRLAKVKGKLRVAEQLLFAVADELEVALGIDAEAVELLRDLANDVSRRGSGIDDDNYELANRSRPVPDP